MSKFAKLILFLSILLFPAISYSAGHDPVLKENTLAALYLHAGRIFNIYLAQAAEILKPENEARLAEVEGQMRQFVPKDFKLSDLLNQLAAFVRKDIFVPDGAMWFSIDADYRPAFSIKARIKPLEFFEYLESLAGKSKAVPQKKEKDLILFEIPTSDFNLHLSIKPDGIFLLPVGEKTAEKGKQWQNFLGKTSESATLLAVEIDMNAIKGMLVKNAQTVQHSNCFANLRILSAAVEMYNMDNPGKLKSLEQRVLQEKHLISGELRCPGDGQYSMKSNEDCEIHCSVHGTVKVPALLASTVGTSSASLIHPQLQVFELIRLSMSSDRADFGLKMNDMNLIEQWLAVGKQQLQVVRHMAENQLGQLPEKDKQKGLKMLDSIKMNSEPDWLKVSIEGLDETTMIAGVAGFAGAVSAIAIPNFVKARGKSQENACKAYRKVITAAVEMYQMDKNKALSEIKLEELVKEGYLKAVPNCPLHGEYRIKADGKEFSVECSAHPDEK